jgi:hypothetical protein
MTTYIIAFEVPDIDRKNALKEKLKQYKAYCPIHDNCWAVLSDQTPTEILDFLDKVLSVSDRIFVMRSGTYSAWKNSYGEKNTEWLKERL